HVGLLDAGEALDRRAVEEDLAVQGLLELATRYLDVLGHAEDAGELEPHEAHAFSVGGLQDLVSLHRCLQFCDCWADYRALTPRKQPTFRSIDIQKWL